MLAVPGPPTNLIQLNRPGEDASTLLANWLMLHFESDAEYANQCPFWEFVTLTFPANTRIRSTKKSDIRSFYFFKIRIVNGSGIVEGIG